MLDKQGLLVYNNYRSHRNDNFIHRGIAQLVEQRSPKPRAEGSSPSAPALKSLENIMFSGLSSFLPTNLYPISSNKYLTD